MYDRIMGVHLAALAAFLLVASTGRLSALAAVLWFALCAAGDGVAIAAVLAVRRRRTRRGIR